MTNPTEFRIRFHAATHSNLVVTITGAITALILASVNPALARASDQAGTLTAIEGDVQLLTSPTDKFPETVPAPATRARFENKYYVSRPARVGDRVEHDNVLRTAPQGKARIVFDNGDQYQVAPGTIYRTSWDRDDAGAKTEVALRQGALRGVITPGGPRSHLRVRTRTATMGVRGTDFSIGTGVTADGVEVTEVSVLRGSVELTATTPPGGKPAAPVEVKRSFSATVSAPKPAPDKTAAAAADAKRSPAPQATVQVRSTTQEDLHEIQKNSGFVRAKQEDLLKAAAPEAAATVRKLEARAGEATLQELKRSDPKLFAQVESKGAKSSDELNALAVQQLIPEAPKAPPTKRKPYRGELDDLEKGAYEKYYKPEE